VLGAMEELVVSAPSLGDFVVPLTILILIGIFLLQRRGTAGVGAVFGPVTLVWFVVIALLGARQVVANPVVLTGIGPWHAVTFLLHDRVHGFLVLGAVLLVVTGAKLSTPTWVTSAHAPFDSPGSPSCCRAAPQLLWAGRAPPLPTRGDREPVLSHGALRGAAPTAGPLHLRHRDRVTSRDLRRLVPDPASDDAGLLAAHAHSTHVG